MSPMKVTIYPVINDQVSVAPIVTQESSSDLSPNTGAGKSELGKFRVRSIALL